ncbi:hypothetical protein PICMEDRAFT_71553 [Pichia membranifaciens NRRL Y-2026]|uniref:Uricase n=1 Tax=Pichia membranifaciens NRRL Y-2026 TaxID=763406 RepID=A0A1E3NMY2_9ASCO|nr:hypothetical protein PICMEDRAFT_71553 [Pichia membranifaciens NRRL Y-2026]ODQ47482.1 hypothetical protein PICMEDRAFT_71553 [Pichia membranifaciens NRRL Y-2026]
MAYLQDSSYGKDNVKFLKVKKDKYNPQKQEVLEATVRVLLRGNFDVSYTKADNSPIVPTDTVKNTVLVEARKTDVWPIERFAAHLAEHFVGKYAHVSGVDVHVIQHKWTKYEVNGKLHDHSFKKDGEDVKTTSLSYNRGGDFQLSSTLKDLTVLKSTGSGFVGYNKCDYTTLAPTTDRILSTDIDCTWNFDSKKIGSIKNVYKLADQGLFDQTMAKVLKITLDRFALENSPSVQATMYNMSADILDECPYVYNVSYSLPNKHYILFDLSWKGLDNDNVLFYPAPNPNGLIKSTVGRDIKAKL